MDDALLLRRSEPEVDHDELNAAIRRAELLLAAGGDPRRRLDPFGPPPALADDLDTPTRREQLRHALEALRPNVEGLRGAREALALLLSDDDLAWKAYATSLLAEALAESEPRGVRLQPDTSLDNP